MTDTGRFMCLSCGRFFSMEHDFKSWETVCPFCGDIFFCNNIIPNLPPYLEGPIAINYACGHKIETDFIGDVKWCPVCGESININIIGLKLKDWQNSAIERCNL